MVKTDQYMIGYVDLLGVKNRTANDYNDNYLRSLSTLFELAKQTAFYVENELKNPNLSIKIFSDNMAVMQKLDKEGYDAAAAVTGFLGHFQLLALMREKWLMRGCITCGELYVDDVFVWGKALLEAYEGESEIANYPRILITRKALKRFNFSNARVDEMCVKRDFDGENFLYYYDVLKMYEEDSKVRKLNEIRSSLESLYKEAKRKAKLMQKIVWQVKLHNNFCKENNLPECMIEGCE